MTLSEQAPVLDWAKTWFKQPKQHYFAGKWQASADASGGYFTSINPATGAVLSKYTMAGSIDIEQAVLSAHQAFDSGAWSNMPRRQRGRLLQQLAGLIRKHAGELATLETLANGKLYREALVDDVLETADVFDYYAGWADKYYGETVPVDKGFLNYTLREPVGVCALIVPWNFPLLLAAWKIAPALITGNTIVVKPSEHTPYSLMRLVQLIDENLDIPKGVVNLLLGDGKTGALLTTHPRVAKISFTGSTAVGKKIAAHANESSLKRITLELGGKSPNIIFADAANLAAVIDRSFQAMFSHKGEKCSEPTRLLVEKPIYDHVLSELKKQADATICGDPFASKSTQGAQCNQAQFDKILRYIDYGKQEGARLLAGGTRDDKAGPGFFVRPTIFADVDNKMRIAQEEIFGPVLSVIPFSGEDEAVRIANDTPYGLAAGFWTSDVSRAHRVAGKLDAGMIFINRYGCYDFASPFGGFKESGWGKEMAIHSLEAYTRSKSVWIKYDE